MVDVLSLCQRDIIIIQRILDVRRGNFPIGDVIALYVILFFQINAREESNDEIHGLT